MTQTNSGSLFWFLMMGVALPAVMVARAFRSPNGRQMQQWAEWCGVVVTPANEELIRSHLGRVRRYRSIAAFPFWWLYPAPLVLGSEFPAALASPVPALAAYLAGALVAELTVGSSGPRPIKQASFSPRTVRDFLPGWIRTLPWVQFAVGGGLVLLSQQTDATSSRTGALLTLGAAAGLALLAELATRRIVSRPQRGGDADVLAADDGLRATAVSMTAGVAVLAGLIAVSAGLEVAVPPTSGAPIGWWGWIALGWPVLSMVLSVGVLSCVIRQQTWGYRRRHRQDLLADLS